MPPAILLKSLPILGALLKPKDRTLPYKLPNPIHPILYCLYLFGYAERACASYVHRNTHVRCVGQTQQTLAWIAGTAVIAELPGVYPTMQTRSSGDREARFPSPLPLGAETLQPLSSASTQLLHVKAVDTWQSPDP